MTAAAPQQRDVAKPETCFYTKRRILDDITNGPWVTVLDGAANRGDNDEARVVVTNIQQLAAGGGRWLGDLPEDFFSLIIVDEGHHNIAPSWQDVFDHFPDAKIISVTERLGGWAVAQRLTIGTQIRQPAPESAHRQ